MALVQSCGAIQTQALRESCGPKQFHVAKCSCLYAGMFHVRSRGSFGTFNASSFSSRVFSHFVGSTIAGSPGSRSQDLGSTGSEKSMDKMASTRTEVAL